jgi:hypothetical protein
MNHKLQTIQDFIDVVKPENIDCLLADFRSFLILAIIEREADVIHNRRPGVMEWIDDGHTDHITEDTGSMSVESSATPIGLFQTTVDEAVRELFTSSLNGVNMYIIPHYGHFKSDTSMCAESSAACPSLFQSALTEATEELFMKNEHVEAYVESEEDVK